MEQVQKKKKFSEPECLSSNNFPRIEIVSFNLYRWYTLHWQELSICMGGNSCKYQSWCLFILAQEVKIVIYHCSSQAELKWKCFYVSGVTKKRSVIGIKLLDNKKVETVIVRCENSPSQPQLNTHKLNILYVIIGNWIQT